MKVLFNPITALILFVSTAHLSYSQSFSNAEMIGDIGFGYAKIKAFDADNDGDLDVLAFPMLYLNDGKGNRQQSIAIGNPNLPIKQCEIADLDGDKDLDIVVTYKSGEVAFFYNDPDGFKPSIQTNKIKFHDSYYYTLNLMDVNADGLIDLVVEGMLGPSLNAYVATANRQFAYFKPFNLQFDHKSEMIGIDLNKDGKEEILVTYAYPKNEKKICYAYQYANDQYQIVDSIAVASSFIDLIQWADMDNDGDLDMVYTSGKYNANMFWNERLKNGKFGKIHTIVKNISLENYTLGDFNNDGDIDFSYITSNHQDNIINWADNLGNDVFNTKSKSLLPNIQKGQFYIYADFDGDKINDVAFVNDNNEQKRSNFSVVLQDKIGKAKQSSVWMTDNKCAGFALLDMNNDGIKDILGYYQQELFYSLIDSLGNYSQIKELAVCPLKIGHLKVDDIDQDGKTDIIICSDDNDGGKMGWYKQLNEGKFSPINLIHKGKGRIRNFELLDADGNSTLDFVFYYLHNDSRGMYTYKNLGKGAFSKTMDTIKTSKEFMELFAEDIDNDGKKEILDLNAKTYFKKTTNGNWAENRLPFWVDSPREIAIANADNDNFFDLIEKTFGNLKWYEYANNKWRDTIIFSKGHDIKLMRIGDMDGDGLEDIVCYLSNYEMAGGDFSGEIGFHYTHSVGILHNLGEGKFTLLPLFPIESLSNLELYDLDGDGDLDIITSVYHLPFSGIAVWRNDNN